MRDLVRQERVNFDENLDEDTRVRRLLQHVAVDAIYPFDIEIVDAKRRSARERRRRRTRGSGLRAE